MSKHEYAPLLPKELREKIKEYRRNGYVIPPLSVVKTPEQIEGIRESAKINTALLDFVSQEIRIGMTTEELDDLVYEFTMSHGAVPAPLNFEGFPKSCCISRNNVVCHGIPSKKEFIREGDIVNVDVSTKYNKYFSDASRMFMMGNVNPEWKRLVEVTKECLEIGIELAQPWTRMGVLSSAIQEHAEKNGYSVVRELVGHGCGCKFHENLEVPHYGSKNKGPVLIPGLTFTIEPMINMGKRDIYVLEDKWTIVTADNLPSAQWEKHILITETGNEVLTY